jgi:hypothetical protein
MLNQTEFGKRFSWSNGGRVLAFAWRTEGGTREYKSNIVVTDPQRGADYCFV